MLKPSGRATHRPMHTRSKPFEAGYAAFLDDVFAHNVSSVARLETAKYRMLVFAGFHRVVASKRTGLLKCERFDRAAGEWRETTSQYMPPFWAKDADIMLELRHAWTQRLATFIPPADICFAKLTKVQVARGDSPEHLRDVFMRLAAERRLATPGVRTAAKRCVVSGVWNFLVDREVLRLCFGVFGRKAGLVEYNYTVRHLDALLARERETPNLLPVIGFYLRSLDGKLTGRQSPPSSIIALAKEHLFAVHEMPPDEQTREARLIGDVTCFGHAQLTPQGWRYLASLTRYAIEQLWRIASEAVFYGDSRQGARIARVLNMLAKTGATPPLAFVLWCATAVLRLERETPAAADTVRSCQSLERFLRLAAIQATVAGKRGRLKRFISGDLVLAWDWFRGDETMARRAHLGNLRGLEKNMTWPAVMRAQHHWHATAAARAEARRAADRVAYARHLAKLRAQTWDSLLNTYQVEDVTCRPLLSGKALLAEGRQMAHCVGGIGYIESCVQGTSRIFSLRNTTERATVELVADGGSRWKVSQVFLKENQPTSRKMQLIAAALARDYSHAARSAKAALGSSRELS